MNISLILKRMRNSIKKDGIGPVAKMVTGQVFWAPALPSLKAIYTKKGINSKQILFMSKPDFSDNAYYLYRYLKDHRSEENYSFVWLVDSDAESFTEDERTIFCSKYSAWHAGLSREALKNLMSSKYVFFTHDSPLHNLKKIPGQTVVNLWHGCGYKNIKSTASWEKENPIDYALVPGKVFIDTKSAFWACSRDKILTIGYPRYDEFREVSDETMNFYRNLKGGAEKLLIWMPTYRKTELSQFAVSKIKGFFELPILKSEEELLKLDRLCADKNIVICIKRHHYQLRYKCEDLDLRAVRFIDDSDLRDAGASLYSLLSLVDGLITDYSSVAIDFMLVDKPMGFTLDDFNEYKDAQGFVFDDPLRYMPGDHIYNSEDLSSFIDDVTADIDRHKEDRNRIMGEVHNPCDNYCERICRHFGL